MNRIKNLTPHAINVGALALPSEGNARVTEIVTPSADLELDIGQIATCRVKYGAVEGLPPSDWTRGEDGWSGTYYVVSAMTASAVRASGDFRDDLLCPGEVVRDGAGKVVGCRSLRRA
jgi:hypothetical protein